MLFSGDDALKSEVERHRQLLHESRMSQGDLSRYIVENYIMYYIILNYIMYYIFYYIEFYIILYIVLCITLHYISHESRVSQGDLSKYIVVLSRPS